MACGHKKDPQQSAQGKQGIKWFSGSNLVIAVIFAIIGYYLITQHKAHIIGLLAYLPLTLFVLLCPLMHLMHHGKHGHHHHEKKDDGNHGRPRDKE